MPITIPRTGPIEQATVPASVRDRLWEEIVRIYAQNHPEIFKHTDKEEETQ